VDYKSARLRIEAVKDAEDKEVGSLGEFEGYLSVFDNEDLGRDVVERGAFTKTIAERPEVPLLWQHWPDEPIGKLVNLAEDQKGLKVKGLINLAVKRGQEAYALLKQGALTGMSIGYDTVKVKEDTKSDTRRLQEIKLWEGSVVTFPMNQQALVEMVKNRQRDIGTSELHAEIKALKDTVEGWKELEGVRTDEAAAEQKTIDTDELIEDVKAGRTLSAQNLARIKKIAEAGQTIASACEELLAAVGEPGDEKPTSDSGGKKPSGSGKEADPDLIQSFFNEITQEIDGTLTTAGRSD